MHLPSPARFFLSRLVLALTFTIAWRSSAVSAASLLYDNGPPGQLTGFEMTQWIEADDFAVTAGSVITSIAFWDLENGNNFQSSITWQIYSDAAGHVPGTLVASGSSMNLSHAATGATPYNYTEYLNSFAISPVALQPGTYWLCLHNGPLNNMVDQRVFWEGTTRIGQNASLSDNAPFNGQWVTNVFAPGLATFALVQGIPRISFNTIADQNYSVTYKNNLTDSSWTSLPGADPLVGTGSLVQVADSDPNLGSIGHRFYRLQTAADLAFQLSGVLRPVVTAVGFNKGTPQVSFSTITGASYRVDYTTSLNSGTWTPVTGAVMVSGTGNTVQVSDPDVNASSPPRCYRVVLLL